MKTITCKPWDVVDRIKHAHPKDKDIEVRKWYVAMHNLMNEGGIGMSPMGATFVKKGKNFVITLN